MADSGYAPLHYVDSLYASTWGGTTTFANMQDANNATTSGFTYTFRLGNYYLNQTYQFTNVQLGFDAYYLCFYQASATTDYYNIQVGTHSWMCGTGGAAEYSILVTSYITSTFYVNMNRFGGTQPAILCGGLYLRCRDDHPPTWNTGNMPANNTWYASVPLLHLTFNDNIQLDSGYRALNHAATTSDYLIFANPFSATYDNPSWNMGSNWNSAAEGQNTLYFLVLDSDNNAAGGSSWCWIFNKDTVAPAAPTGLASSTHVVSTWSINRQITVTWTAANDGASGSGIAGYRTRWSRGASDPGTTAVNNTSLTETSPVLSDTNNWYFNIRARDNVGHWSGYVSLGPFMIDDTAPAQPAPSSSTQSPSVWSSSASISVSWSTPSDGTGSGIAGYSYSWSNNSANNPDATIDTASTTLTNVAADGLWYFNLRSVDGVSLASTTCSIGPFLIDTTTPSIPAPSSTSHTPCIWSTDPTINITWPMPSDLGGSGVGGYAYSWSSNNPQDPGTTSNINATSLSSKQSDGVWYFNIRVVDRVGHWSSYSSIGPFKIDTTAPGSVLPSCTTHAMFGCSRLQDIAVNWSIANDNGGSGIQGYSFLWSEGSMPTDPDYVIDANVTTNSTKLSDGSWCFSIRSCDNLGLWSSAIGIGPFIIDTIVPSAIGPGNFNITAGTTGNTINWTLADANPGTYILYMNGSVYTSATNWTSSSTIHVPIDGLSVGTYNFTIFVTDEAGNNASHMIMIRVLAAGGNNPIGSPMVIGLYILLFAGIAAAIVIAGVVVVKKRKVTGRRSTEQIEKPVQENSQDSEPSTPPNSENDEAGIPSQDVDATKTNPEGDATPGVDLQDELVKEPGLPSDEVSETVEVKKKPIDEQIPIAKHAARKPSKKASKRKK
ncbi:MAG TPA: hypothetical protein VKM55_01170 [Candidatus Lokiarchaeia archaeon]|nr:hypothetical protein [Candidatus Lokiarchaeia archaeon]